MRVSSGFRARELALIRGKVCRASGLCSLVFCGRSRCKGHMLNGVDTHAGDFIQHPDELIDNIDSAVNHVLENRQYRDLHVPHEVRDCDAGFLPAELELVYEVNDPVDASKECELDRVPAHDKRELANLPRIFNAADRLNPPIHRRNKYADDKGNPENRIREERNNKGLICRDCQPLSSGIDDPRNGENADRSSQPHEYRADHICILREEGDDIIQPRDDGRKDRQKLLSHNAGKLEPALGEKPGLVGVAILRAGKVALRIGGRAHKVIVPEHDLLGLRHFVVGRRDTLRECISLKVSDRHVNAELLQGLCLAGDTGTDFLEGGLKVKVVERRHVAGKADHIFRHIYDGVACKTGRLEHGADSAGVPLCAYFVHTVGSKTFFRPRVDSLRSASESNVDDVLDFGKVGGIVNSGLDSIKRLAGNHHKPDSFRKAAEGVGRFIRVVFQLVQRGARSRELFAGLLNGGGVDSPSGRVLHSLKTIKHDIHRLIDTLERAGHAVRKYELRLDKGHRPPPFREPALRLDPALPQRFFPCFALAASFFSCSTFISIAAIMNACVYGSMSRKTFGGHLNLWRQ